MEFVEELVKLLNGIASEQKSKYRFKFVETSNDYKKLKFCTFIVYYSDNEFEELFPFVSYKCVINKEEERTKHIAEFKKILLRRITLVKDVMGDYVNVKSIKTLLAKPKVEKKLFSKYLKYLEDYDRGEDESIEPGEGRIDTTTAIGAATAELAYTI